MRRDLNLQTCDTKNEWPDRNPLAAGAVVKLVAESRRPRAATGPGRERVSVRPPVPGLPEEARRFVECTAMSMVGGWPGAERIAMWLGLFHDNERPRIAEVMLRNLAHHACCHAGSTFPIRLVRRFHSNVRAATERRTSEGQATSGGERQWSGMRAARKSTMLPCVRHLLDGNEVHLGAPGGAARFSDGCSASWGASAPTSYAVRVF